MPAIQGKQGPLPTKTVQYRDFSTGLARAGSRPGIPETALWTCENAQVIGPGQLVTLTDHGTPIVSLTPGPTSLWGVIITLAGVSSSRLIAVRSDGSISAIHPDTGAVTAICGAGVMGSDTRIVMWRDTHVLMGSRTHGYASWDGTTFVKYPATFTANITSGNTVIVWTGGTPSTALAPGMGLSGTGLPGGTSIIAVIGANITVSATPTATTAGATVTVGTGAPASVRDLAVFEGRVWLVTSGRGFVFSGPLSFTTFETVYTGGSATMPDSIFQGNISRILSAVQLLWIFGPNAINTISNVQVVSGVTLFQNENVVAGIGTVQGDSVQPLFRTLIFHTPAGEYAILGATPQKLTDQLDGLFRDVTAHGSCPASVFTLNNIMVYAVLVNLSGVAKLLVYTRPAWAVADQGTDLTWITTLVRTTGEIEAWGTNGTDVFRLFAGLTGHYSIESKHFDYGSFVQRKQILRAAVEAQVSGAGEANLELILQNETSEEEAIGSVVPSFVTWFNNVGSVVTWLNELGDPVPWLASGQLIVQGGASLSGNLLGFKLRGTESVALTIGAVAWELTPKGEWTFGP